MRAGCDLLKIVHVFRWRETVLFEFVLPYGRPIRPVLPRSLYNEKIQLVGENLSSADGPEVHHKFAQNRLPHEGGTAPE